MSFSIRKPYLGDDGMERSYAEEDDPFLILKFNYF